MSGIKFKVKWRE